LLKKVSGLEFKHDRTFAAFVLWESVSSILIRASNRGKRNTGLSVKANTDRLMADPAMPYKFVPLSATDAMSFAFVGLEWRGWSRTTRNSRR
jgi:hypothetical protein